MDLQFTAVFRKVPEGYIGFVEELPGANTQGATLAEARANLQEAVALVLEANRMIAREDAPGSHNEINNDLARKICKDLQVPQPDVNVRLQPPRLKMPSAAWVRTPATMSRSKRTSPASPRPSPRPRHPLPQRGVGRSRATTNRASVSGRRCVTSPTSTSLPD